MKPTLLAVLVLLLVPAAAGAYQRPPENHGGYISTTQVRHDAAALAVKTARRTGASRAEITICRHLRQFHVRRVVPHVVSEAAFTKPEAMQLLADISKLADVEGR